MFEWIKALHIIFMVTWFAGIFYLPRLFVYHADPTNSASFEVFKVMERKLYIMMTLGGTLTLIFGLTLFSLNHEAYLATFWFPAKFVLICLLIGYHFWCKKIMMTFREDNNQRSHRWYRVFNEAPVLLLVAIVFFVVMK